MSIVLLNIAQRNKIKQVEQVHINHISNTVYYKYYVRVQLLHLLLLRSERHCEVSHGNEVVKSKG